MPCLHWDVETRSAADLTKIGARRYAADPSTVVLCVGYAVDDTEPTIWTPGQPVPWQFIEAAADANWLSISHNDIFEREVEAQILHQKYDWPIIPLAGRRCSMALAQANGLPGSLEEAAALLGLTNQKDMAGHDLMLELCDASKPLDPVKLERLFPYCMQDVRTERELYGRFPPLTPDEQKVWEIDQTINARGFAVDLTLAQAARKIAAEEKKDINARISALTDGEITTAGQRDRILKYIRERGHKVKSLGKRNVAQILARDPDEETRQILELRRAGGRTSVTKFHSAITGADTDSRMRDTFRYYGSHTGRWAGRSFQPQNLPKPTIENLDAATDAVLSGDHARVRAFNGADTLSILSNVVRNVVIAKPGHTLIGADLSAIESRVLTWLADERWKLNNYREYDRTGDPKLEPYCVTASRMLHREVTPDDEEGRQKGKVGDLGLGFAGGVPAWRKFLPDDPRSDEQIMRESIRPWRAAHPAIRRFWKGIERLFKTCVRTGKPATYGKIAAEMVDGALRLTLPSGRCLVYRDAKLGPGRFEDSLDLHFHNGYEAAQAWFGTIVENIVQGISRDLLAGAMLRLEAAGFPIVLHCHDEAVCEVPEDQADEAHFLKLMTALPGWAEGLPIAAKTWTDKRYGKSKRGADVPDDHADDAATENVEESCGPTSSSSPDVAPSPDQGDQKTNSTDKKELPPWEEEQNDGDTASTNNGATNDTEDDNYSSGEQPKGRNVTAYIYRDAGRQPYLKIVRTSAKQFPQYHWEGGRWLKGKPKGPKIPFRLPELLAAAVATPIFITEGEKDAENVAALGFIATTNSEGAGKGKWTSDLNRWFTGRQTVYICEDNDDDGRRHAREVANALRNIVTEVRIVSFSELPAKHDVSDWLALGHTPGELLARAKAAPLEKPDGYVLVRASDIIPRKMDWLWQGHILRGSQELLTGIPGGGKSQIHCAFVAYATTGGAWPDGYNGAPAGNVIMLTAEDCLDQTIVPRLIVAGADRDRVHLLKKIRRDNKERMFLLGEDLDMLAEMIAKLGDVRLITIDPITAYMGHKLDSHRATDVRGQLGPLADLAERSDVALSCITHPPKHTSQRAIDHFIGSQAFIAAARIGHMTVEEMDEDEHGNRLPTGRSLFTNPKNNVSRKMSTLAYRIVEKPLDGGLQAPCISWEEIVDITADQAVEAATPSKNRRSDAAIFLADILANGPVLVTLIEERATERELSKEQLKHAKQKMGIVAFKEHGKLDGQWFWALPQHAPKTDAAS